MIMFYFIYCVQITATKESIKHEKLNVLHHRVSHILDKVPADK